MIPRRSPLRRWQPRVRGHRKPGGEYVFVHRGQEYRLAGKFVQDNTSPDGLRWIAAKESKPILTRIVFELADGRCQMKNAAAFCWGYVPRWSGHPHHVRHKKMGGAFTDDRIWLEIDGEKTQIRIWGCPVCHRDHHDKLHWRKNLTSERS